MVGARFPKQSVPYPAEWAAFFNPSQPLDITLPGIRRPIGAEHPVIKTMNEIVGVFRNLGYSVEEGPEIETDYYNFEALNFSSEPSGARYAGYAVHRRARLETAAATACCCARTRLRCRFAPCRR